MLAPTARRGWSKREVAGREGGSPGSRVRAGNGAVGAPSTNVDRVVVIC